MLFSQKKIIWYDLIVSIIEEGGKNRIIKKIIMYSLKKYFSQLKNDVKYIKSIYDILIISFIFS